MERKATSSDSPGPITGSGFVEYCHKMCESDVEMQPNACAKPEKLPEYAGPGYGKLRPGLETNCLRKGGTSASEIRVISGALTKPLGFASVRRVSETEECNRLKSINRGLKRLDEPSQPLLRNALSFNLPSSQIISSFRQISLRYNNILTLSWFNRMKLTTDLIAPLGWRCSLFWIFELSCELFAEWNHLEIVDQRGNDWLYISSRSQIFLVFFLSYIISYAG